MELQKVCFVKSVIFILTLMIFLPGFQGKKEETISFPGVIESIDKNFKFIVVNEARIFVTADTNIVDEKGNILKIDDLKPKLSVAIEGVRSPDGFFAKKIVIKTLKRKQ
jgi:hypothetical protein